jgi:hypothetical protein
MINARDNNDRSNILSFDFPYIFLFYIFVGYKFFITSNKYLYY